MTNYTDEELMDLVKNHDISAFEELFGRYQRRIFAFFCRLLWNFEEAADCTQETYLRLWRGRDRYTSNGRFSSYIFQIAKNHFLNEHEKRKSRIILKHASASGSKGPPENETAPDSTYGQVLANEVGSAIAKAIGSLPEIHRLVYVLSEEQKLSYKEIADVLECPVGTVSSRKVEAVRKLRKMLEPLKDDFFGKDPRNLEKNK